MVEEAAGARVAEDRQAEEAKKRADPPNEKNLFRDATYESVRNPEAATPQILRFHELRSSS